LTKFVEKLKIPTFSSKFYKFKIGQQLQKNRHMHQAILMLSNLFINADSGADALEPSSRWKEHKHFKTRVTGVREDPPAALVVNVLDGWQLRCCTELTLPPFAVLCI